MAVTTVESTPDHQLRPHNIDQDVAVDGDIRYRPDIQGYSRDVRKRVRDTEHQVNLLVTARIRDTSTAAQELLPATMSDRVREIVQVTRGVRARQIKPCELRAALVSLAATATICAEAADRPRSLGGSPDAQAGLQAARPTNVVPIRLADRPGPVGVHAIPRG